MSRRRAHYLLKFSPQITYFKPRGVPLTCLQVMSLSRAELEALHLKFYQKLDQRQSAQQMNISQSTFHRLLQMAMTKVSQALIEGQAIELQTSNFQSAPDSCHRPRRSWRASRSACKKRS